MVLISDSLSAAGEGSGAGAAAVGAGPLAWPCASWGGVAAPRQALCSPARLGRLPGPTCSQLEARPSFLSRLKEGCAQPAVSRAPLPRVCAIPGILTPGGPSWGQKSSPVPSGRSPPPAALGPPAGR